MTQLPEPTNPPVPTPTSVPTTMGRADLVLPVTPGVAGVALPSHIPPLMWFVVAILAIVPQTLLAWATLNQSKQNHTKAEETKQVAEEAKKVAVETKEVTEDTHIMFNSRFDKVLAEAKLAAEAKGVLKEKERAATQPSNDK